MQIKYVKHLDNVVRKDGEKPAEDQIRLSSSERDIPYYMENVWDKFLESLKQQDIFCYPDTDKVYDVLEATTAVFREHLIFGHGSDSILKNIFYCFAEKKSKIITTDPCFPMYDVYANIVGADLCKIPYKDKKTNIDDIVDAIDDNTSLIVLSNPNSPIGDGITTKNIKRIITAAKKYNSIVVIDEAYIEFSNVLTYMNKSPEEENVIVTKTYSKAMGAAGIRFGFASSNKQIINILKKVQNMYEVTNFSIKVLELLNSNQQEIRCYIQDVIENRAKLVIMLRERGFEAFETDSNWIYTTKTNFHRALHTKQCKLPWDDRDWTRLQVPAKISTLNALINY